MPSLTLAADNSAFPAPAAVYNWRIYGLALSASMGSAMFGYDSAFIGGAITLPSFESTFGLADASSSKDSAALQANIVSTFQAGCFFGAIIVSFFAERFGRKWPLVVCGVIFNVGAILQVISPGIVGILYSGRVLTGVAVGASSLVVPQYISECAPPAIRGRLVGIFETTLQMSQIVGFWVNYGVNQNLSNTSPAQWRIPFGLQLLPGTALVLLMLLQRDSPRWLVQAGRTDEALQVLSHIRRLAPEDAYLAWEAQSIQDQLTHEAELGPTRSIKSKLKNIFGRSSNLQRVLVGMALMVLQNLLGINALNYYSPSIFKSIGFSGPSVGLLATGVFGIVKAMATLVFMFFGIDHLGRRRSMLIGSSGALLAMIYLGVYTKLSGSFQGGAVKDAGSYVAITMIYLFAVFYAMSWNGIPWIYCAEIFPTGIRSLCLVFTTCAQWLAQFVIVYSTPYMIESITYGTFLFFGCCTFIAVIVVYLFMPETKGLSLEDMDVMFEIKGFASQKRQQADEIITARQNAENIVDTVKREEVNEGEATFVESTMGTTGHEA